MTEAMIVAVIAGSFSILSGLIAAVTTVSSRRSRERWESLTSELVRAHEDVAAFHRLEEMYTDALATDERSARSWKLEIRQQLRDTGHSTPGQGATAHRSAQRIARLS